MKNYLLLILLAFTLQKICLGQDIEGAKIPADPASQPHPEIPKGEVLEFKFSSSKIYPGTTRTYSIYIPAAYKPDKPACLYFNMDGVQFHAPQVFDYLIAKGEMPVTIGVFVQHGILYNNNDKDVVRYNRSHEFDSMNNDFVNFLLTELLPEVEKQKATNGRPINISKDPNDHAIAGSSSGGICAFTAAWQRPDAFNRVFSAIGTYVAMRGGDEYPALIRKTEPKPIRVYLQDGSNDAWNPLFGSWYTGNLNVEAALSFAGYEVAHTWGSGGHSGVHANNIFPDVMRWLWKGWPQRVQNGISNNNMLSAILTGTDQWQEVAINFMPSGIMASLPENRLVIKDINGAVYCVNANGTTALLASNSSNPVSIAGSPDGKIYALDHKSKQLFIIDNGKKRIITNGISGKQLVVSHEGNIYITAPAVNDEEPGSIILIKSDRTKSVADTGLRFASALTVSPDHKMLLVAEDNTNWIYSYTLQKDGSLKFKQKWYWLHQTDNFGYTRVNALAMDNSGNLYAATNSGIQVCDQNARVRAILQLPGGGMIAGLCFGGDNFNTLYVVCGGKLYMRKLKVAGVPSWAEPVYPKSIGSG